MDKEPSPDPLMLGAEPELAEGDWRKRELLQTSEFVREEIFIEQFGIDPVPRLPDLHEPVITIPEKFWDAGSCRPVTFRKNRKGISCNWTRA